MSSLLGVGGLPEELGGDSGGLTFEDVLALLADCEDTAAPWEAAGQNASHSSDDNGDSPFSLLSPAPSDGELQGDGADSLSRHQVGGVQFDAVAEVAATQQQLLVDMQPPQTTDHHPPSAAAARGRKKAAGTTGKKKKAGYNSNKARDERKEELLYLRKKVEQMQTYLTKLRASTAATARGGDALVARRPRVNGLSARAVAEIGPVWEDVAARQYKERRRAEMENIRLKLVLESQIKMAKSLEKILNKRHNDRVMESIRGKQQVKRVDRPIGVDDDAAIFRDLLAGIENALVEVDQDFEANGLARMVKPYHDAQLRQDDGDGVVMEVFANKIMPFNPNVTADAVWDHFAHSMQHMPTRFVYEKQLKNVTTSDDMIIESFGLELAGSRNTKCTLHVRQILRKFVQPERVVIAWRVHAEPLEVSTERTDGICLIEKGYTVIKRVKPTVDSHSLVQTCYILRPEIQGTISEPERKVGAITDFILESVARTISASHQMIENVLMDKALRATSPICT